MKINLNADSVNQIVKEDLKGYYDTMLNHPTETDNHEVIKAIEVLLTQYMTKEEYNQWRNEVSPERTDIIRDWEC